MIFSFSATPASLLAAGTSLLNWQVLDANSLSIDQGIGVVMGNSSPVTVAATTIYTLTATNDMGTSTATTAVVVGQNPSERAGRTVSMMSPTSGETFIAPTTLRLVASAIDPNIQTNSPVQGVGRNAAKVQFFVDDAVVLEVDGANAEYNVFKGFVSGVASGQHRVWARAIYSKTTAEVLDSAPALITVEEPPAYGKTVDLAADITLSGSMPYELVGTADSRVRLNGNGHRIVSSGASTGNLTLRFVDVFDLGSRTTTQQPGFAVTTNGTVTVEDSTFDNSDPVQISAGTTGTASWKRNLFRSNMRMPIGQLPDGAAGGPSVAVAVLGGGARGVFAGNNVGASWVEFGTSQGWVIGGDTDADSNVIIGPRGGIALSTDHVQIRRNYTHDVYFGGWSQGSNVELFDKPDVIVEHNVIFGGSWPVRGVAGEFRYNLVLHGGHQWLWASGDGANVHHNLFVGGNIDIAGIYVIYEPMNVRIANNTFDGQGEDVTTAIEITKMSATATTTASAALTSNLFLNIKKTPVTISGGMLTSDYNMFFAATTPAKLYSDSRAPAHDKSGADAMLTDPPTVVFDLDEAGVWKRNLTVRDIVTRYRMRYAPKAGSPVIDAGDPAGGAGNDVGAVGGGEVSASDHFGQL